MGIIFDILLALIILINVYFCYKKGLVKLAVGLIAVVAAVIISLVIYKPVSNIVIKNTEIDENIKKAIIENFMVKEEEEAAKDDEGLMKYMEKYVDDAVNKTKTQIVIEASNIISEKVINIGVIIAIFIIVRVLLILLVFVADIITELPIIKQFNDVGGLLYGIVKSLLIVYVLLAVVFFIVYTTGNTTISDTISNSFLTKFFYNNNILLNILF